MDVKTAITLQQKARKKALAGGCPGGATNVNDMRYSCQGFMGSGHPQQVYEMMRQGGSAVAGASRGVGRRRGVSGGIAPYAEEGPCAFTHCIGEVYHQNGMAGATRGRPVPARRPCPPGMIANPCGPNGLGGPCVNRPVCPPGKTIDCVSNKPSCQPIVRPVAGGIAPYDECGPCAFTHCIGCGYQIAVTQEEAEAIAGGFFPPTCDACAPCVYQSTCTPCDGPQRAQRWGNQYTPDDFGGRMCFRPCPPDPCLGEVPPERMPRPEIPELPPPVSKHRPKRMQRPLPPARAVKRIPGGVPTVPPIITAPPGQPNGGGVPTVPPIITSKPPYLPEPGKPGSPTPRLALAGYSGRVRSPSNGVGRR